MTTPSLDPPPAIGAAVSGRIIRAFAGAVPRIDPDAWIAPGAVVVGDVEVGPGSSVWYGAVLRGDVHAIRVGARTNVQDRCVLHVTRDRFPCWVGDEVTLGHGAIVHGCRVGDGALIGIGAVVLDGVEIGAEALVAAGAVVAPGTCVPEGVLMRGVPARNVRKLSDDERRLQRAQALHYVETARGHAAEDAEV